MGTTHYRTTAYHPAANGMVERFHRQLKAAIKCHKSSRWTEILPTVMLGIRAAWKDDIKATAAEMLYGQSLRLPGEFLSCRSSLINEPTAEFVNLLRQHIRTLRPTTGSNHGRKATFVFKDLTTTEHVFVRNDGPKGPLQQVYDGPYKVITRSKKTFVIDKNGHDVTVSIDRLKPAYVVTESDHEDDDNENDTTQSTTIIVQRPRTLPAPEKLAPEGLVPAAPSQGALPELLLPSQQPEDTIQRTRSGRRVRFPDRLQVGLS